MNDDTACIGYVQTISTRVDNTSTLKVNFDETEVSKSLRLFGTPGTKVAVVIIKEEV